jgi:2-polyprenyl-6-methoxyphenol hydroxylase-like FAD-dependent oxidoreductase
VQARSLEIYRQLGVVDTVIGNGRQTESLIFNKNGKKVAQLPITNIGQEQTPFPYVLVYQQYKNERVLLDYLTQNCCPVYWNTSLKTADQQADKTTVTLTNGDDKEFTLTCNWLIGADGAHSVVRKQMNIPFNGDTYSHLFYLADVSLDTSFGADINLYLSAEGFAGFFPMPEDKRYRVIGNLPESLTDKKDLTLDDVLPWLNRVTSTDQQIVECHWFTTYKLHHRMAEKFRFGRCFLIGDAAHIHSPVGGQGMNTGLQDAYNLAWKLAAVVNKQVDARVLDTYADERMPVARELLKTTDRAFNIVMSNSVLSNLFKKWVLPHALKWLWSSAKLRETFFKLLSQTGISYRDSKISLHLSQGTQVKAGDRLPYLKVFDEKKHEETDLHEWCSKPGFTLIALGHVPESELFALARWITQNYLQQLNFFYLPPTNKNRHVFDAFELKADQRKTLIVRPDMYIGLIADVTDTATIDNYMRNVVFSR